MYRSLLLAGATTLIVVGCARSPAEDWHQFLRDTVSVQQEIQTASKGWGEIHTLTGQSQSPQKTYASVISILDTTVIPAQERALAALKDVHPRTPEARAVETRFRNGLEKMQQGAKQLRDATVKIQSGR